MAAKFTRISNCLWFDEQAEEAANLYMSIFDNSRILRTQRYMGESAKMANKPEGSLLSVIFELDGTEFLALNGGPHFKFNEAVSLMIHCRDQNEIDHYWEALTAGGDPAAQQCGWLKDRFGVSWQVTPDRLLELTSDPDPARAKRAMDAMMKMKKLDLAELERAADGG